jgi:hypothetical protein
MTRTPPALAVPSRHLARVLIGALVGAVALAGCSQTDEGAPAPTTVAVADTAAPPTVPAPTTATTTTTAAAPEPAAVPAAGQSVADMAGGDPQEAACITADVGRGLQSAPVANQAGSRNQVVGAAVAACLPPAKLAAAVAQRVQSGALGMAVAAPAVDCIRATLVGSAADAAYAPFVGAVFVGDAPAAHRSAAVFDAACGTTFAAGG